MGSVVKLEDYNATLEILIQDLLNDEKVKVIPARYNRLEKIIRYTVPNDSEIKGYPIAQTYSMLAGDKLTDMGIGRAYILGWCFQMLLTHWIMMDDYFDDDEARWGKPTWYYANGRNKIAICDTMLLQQAAYSLLGKYFGSLPIYPKLLDYFSNASFEFFLGQNLENQLIIQNESGISGFSIDNLNSLNRYINNNTFIAARFHLGMILAGYQRDEIFQRKLESICIDIVDYTNVRDDINDSFGDGMNNPLCDKDIRTGKCKWPIIKARELANGEQWNTLVTCYGKDDEANVKIVKGILMDLGIPELGKEEAVRLETKIERDITELKEDGSELGKILLETLTFFVRSGE